MSSSPDHSYNRLDGTESITTRPDVHSLDTASLSRPTPRSDYHTKHSSAYVPHNRLSRYTTALINLVPVRFKRTPGPELPLDKIGLFSSVSFSWLNEYLYVGCKNGMRNKALPTAAEQDSCQVNGPRLDGLWHAHVVERGQAGASVPRIAWKFVRTRVLMASLIYMLGTLLSLLSPIFLLQGIISAIEDRDMMYNSTATSLNGTILVTSSGSLTTVSPSVSNLINRTTIKPPKVSVGGKLLHTLPDSIKHKIMIDEAIIFINIIILIVAEIVSHFLIAWSSTLNLRTASRLRSACLALVYKKLIHSSVRYRASAYQTITYFVPDSETLYDLMTNGPLIFTGPITLILISVFVWHLMGNWALIGIAVLVLFYLCLILTAYLTSVFATKTMDYSLTRMSLVEEFVSNIYLSKVTLWDSCFRNKIEETRSKELVEMRLGGLSEGWSLCMVHFIPVITVCTTTMAALLTLRFVEPADYMIMLVILLINLKQCVRSSWLAMSSISRGFTSLNKLKAVLILKEADRYPDKPIDKNLAITINRGNFKWVQDKQVIDSPGKRTSQFYLENHDGVPVRFNVLLVTDTLTDINFYAPKGKLIGICGEPGSGKSSLLLALMGHLNHISGYVTRDGTCAYVPETPWLIDGTLKENIVFGETFDSNRYYKAIQSCLLHTDMALLPASDDTDLTEINLSVAQKQRITLARAVYARKDINLLDNPLADVIDVNESNQIFEKCCLEAMRRKTVIMVSEKIQFLNRCDTIYVMRHGRIVDEGTHEELIKRDGEYIRLIRSYMKKYQRKYFRDGEPISPSSAQLLMVAAPRGVLNSSSTNASLDSILDDVEDSAPLKHELTSEFPVKFSTDAKKPVVEYGIYVRNAGGWCAAIGICIVSMFCAFFIAVAPLSFTYIAQRTIDNNVHVIIVFAIMVGSIIVFGLILMWIYNTAVYRAAMKLHNQWIDNLCTAKMSLFTMTPISVLLNTCSLNLYEVDSVLPRSLITILMHIGISIFSSVILGIISPWLLIPIAVFVIAAIAYSIYVRGAITGLYEVKVNSVVPMYNHALNTIAGRTTIQAYHKEKDFKKKFYRHCDHNSTYNFMLHAIKLWMEYRINLLGALTLAAVIFICVLLSRISNKFELLVLATICTLQLIASTVYIIGATASAYTSFMAITGLDFYIKNISKEHPGKAGLPANWPIDGSVKFDNVILSIGPDVDPDLDVINFEVASGEKIALIGSQTTSKISILSALYKIIEVVSGKISIGNTNISDVPTDKLRQCIAFVPSDPLLFNGNIKYNLDPTGKLSEKELMVALQRVFLWEKVSKLADKLESDATNCFTVGERKMMFLARVILRNTVKVIIIEESITDLGADMEKTLEIVLRDVFSEHTVIVLSTQRVRYCQRTLVLNHGKVIEASNRKSSTSQHSIANSEVLVTAAMNSVFETSF